MIISVMVKHVVKTPIKTEVKCKEFVKMTVKHDDIM
jgi:hypothetical protein